MGGREECALHESGVAGTADVSRILVVQPPGGAPRMARGLARLPGHTTVEIVHDAGSCLERCQAGRVDALVLDARQAVEATRVLDATRVTGPPAVVIGSNAQDDACLAWFRAGAADVLPEGLAEERLSLAIGELLDRAAALRQSHAARSGTEALANREALDHLNSALLVVDSKGRIVYGNPAAELILGGGGEALHGASVWRWFRTGPRAENPIARSLQGERLKGAEALLTRRDGAVTLVGISCAPIAAPDGPLRGAVAIFQDLSEVTQRRSQALQTEKLASIGQLAAGVAHEINNPMGFIHANLFQMAEYVADLRRVWSRVDTLQRVLRDGDSAAVEQANDALTEASQEADVGFVLSDLAKAIRESQEGSERIRHIVQDLRDFSHQDTGELELSDLNECLDSTANIVWPMMRHVVVLEKSYAELPPVSCFPMQLQQVFLNLLMNAFQAIEEALGSSGGTGTIALATAVEGDAVVVSIRDTGVGIPPEHLDRIFDPFFTTKNVGAGTGLGLSTSFGIVQRHGGTLSVESRMGEGTLFRLRLPIASEQAS
jgi:PAS domain S-box-containing protein